MMQPGKFMLILAEGVKSFLIAELRIDNIDDCDAMVVIDAPHLEYLRLKDGFLASYLVRNKPAISEVSIDVGEIDRNFASF
ncbi:hypothetical protein Tco_0703820 [Tanacetum coccineum]|uniref:Uncharacterized protein n=1 Tax=Tanacetum coccineum TaxID=301880 RepID=A0ABQ4Y016_9ASTR